MKMMLLQKLKGVVIAVSEIARRYQKHCYFVLSFHFYRTSAMAVSCLHFIEFWAMHSMFYRTNIRSV